MNTQTDQEINKTLSEYSLITFESEIDQDRHINFGDRKTFDPASSTIESIRKETENLLLESLTGLEWGDGFDWHIGYVIYGLPVNTPADSDILQNRNKWTQITRGKIRIML